MRHADLEISNKHIEVIGNSVDFDDQLIILMILEILFFVGSMFYEPNTSCCNDFCSICATSYFCFLDSSVRFYIEALDHLPLFVDLHLSMLLLRGLSMILSFI